MGIEIIMKRWKKLRLKFLKVVNNVEVYGKELNEYNLNEIVYLLVEGLGF